MKCDDCDTFSCIEFCRITAEGLHYAQWEDGEYQYSNKNGLYHREDGPATDLYTVRWFWHGWQAIVIKEEELYRRKVIEMEGKTGVVVEQMNDFFFKILIGDEKKLVVSLDKYKEG